MEKKKFREIFPHLADELENGSNKVSLGDNGDGKNTSLHTDRKWVGYDPNVIDFLRRCETDEQALEILEYLENNDTISSETADKFRKQLTEEGVRSFGDLKEKDYYHKNTR